MAQKEFKKANFAKLFNCNVFFGDYLQYISWAVKNSKTVDMLTTMKPSDKVARLNCLLFFSPPVSFSRTEPKKNFCLFFAVHTRTFFAIIFHSFKCRKTVLKLFKVYMVIC